MSFAAAVLTAFAIVSEVVGPTPGYVDRAAESQLRAQVVAEHARVCDGAVLTGQRKMTALARWRSRDMAVHHYFSHEDRRGRHVGERFRAWRIRYSAAGEDLAWNLYPAELAADGAYAQLMGSTTHRRLIRDCNYTRVAVGAYRFEDRTVFTVLFKRP